MSRKQLIIIPGLGDRGWLYNFVKPIWFLLGFDAHIFVFNWGDKRLTFAKAQANLLSFVDSLDAEEVYVIGCSAGGTAAVNALANRDNIISVVTVCTPYVVFPYLKNKLLTESINCMTKNLHGMKSAQISKISALYGFYDLIVPYAKSKPKNIKTGRVYSLGHCFSISAALTVYSLLVKRRLLAKK